ncbi:MAG: TM2 domain-containing protein [Pseudorhodobacter sp.]|nr:TM2 domain-containing protein [Rhizobacter sp.]
MSKSKTVATWLALIGGSLGLHRFYLFGARDMWAWLIMLPTFVGAYGIHRMRELGQDDMLAWLLIPLLGFALAASTLTAVIYGLHADERWNAKFNASAPSTSGWQAIVGVMFALLIGTGVLMATIAFSAQRYFEYQAETTTKP